MIKVNARGLKKRRRLWYAEKRIPVDVKDHFKKARFQKSMQTDSLPEAIRRSEPILKEWSHLIEMARHKNKGHVIDLEDALDVAEKSFERHGSELRGTAAATISVDLDKVLDSASKAKRDRLKVVGEVTGTLTPLKKYMKSFVNDHGYTAAGKDDNMGIITRWSKEFPYFEVIETEALISFITNRMAGSDGKKLWSRTTVGKHLSILKQYWLYCLRHSHISVENKINHERLLPTANKTKSHTGKKRNKDSNLAYAIEDAWRLQITAKDNDPKLADMILLGMYTGCRIGELAHMLKEDVHSDRFNIADSKTDSGIRSIPIHTDILQDVERMVQTSKDEYLICGLSSKNKHGNRGKGIGQKFMRHKAEQGFKKKEHTFHSLRSTLATLFQSAGVEELFAARIIGHKAGGMTYGLYAGDLDWDKAVEAMAKVDFKNAA